MAHAHDNMDEAAVGTAAPPPRATAEDAHNDEPLNNVDGEEEEAPAGGASDLDVNADDNPTAATPSPTPFTASVDRILELYAPLGCMQQQVADFAEKDVGPRQNGTDLAEQAASPVAAATATAGAPQATSTTAVQSDGVPDITPFTKTFFCHTAPASFANLLQNYRIVERGPLEAGAFDASITALSAPSSIFRRPCDNALACGGAACQDAASGASPTAFYMSALYDTPPDEEDNPGDTFGGIFDTYRGLCSTMLRKAVLWRRMQRSVFQLLHVNITGAPLAMDNAHHSDQSHPPIVPSGLEFIARFAGRDSHASHEDLLQDGTSPPRKRDEPNILDEVLESESIHNACQPVHVRVWTFQIACAMAWFHSRGMPFHAVLVPECVLDGRYVRHALPDGALGDAIFARFQTEYLRTRSADGRFVNASASISRLGARATLHDRGLFAYTAPEDLLKQRPGTTIEADMWVLGRLLLDWSQQGVAAGEAGDVFLAGPGDIFESQFSQLIGIFQALGLPDVKTWPEVTSMPGFNASLPSWPSKPLILANVADPVARDLIRGLLVLNPKQRMNVHEVIRHPFFAELREWLAPYVAVVDPLHRLSPSQARKLPRSQRRPSLHRLIPDPMPLEDFEAGLCSVACTIDTVSKYADVVSASQRASTFDGLSYFGVDCSTFLQLSIVANPIPLKPCHFPGVDITEHMRGILVDWLGDVASEFLLSEDVIFVTMGLVDRVLYRIPIARRFFQLLGAACMVIAGKLTDVCHISFRDVVYVCDMIYTDLDVQQMELVVLATVDMHMSMTTPLTHVRVLLGALKPAMLTARFNKECIDSVGHLSFYLCNVFLQAWRYNFFSGECIALASVCLALSGTSDGPVPVCLYVLVNACARRIKNGNSSLSDSCMCLGRCNTEGTSAQGPCGFYSCMQSMLGFWEKQRSAQLCAVRTRYERSGCGSVGLMTPAMVRKRCEMNPQKYARLYNVDDAGSEPSPVDGARDGALTKNACEHVTLPRKDDVALGSGWTFLSENSWPSAQNDAFLVACELLPAKSVVYPCLAPKALNSDDGALEPCTSSTRRSVLDVRKKALHHGDEIARTPRVSKRNVVVTAPSHPATPIEIGVDMTEHLCTLLIPEVLEFLDIRDLCAIARVSRTWRRYTYDSFQWRRVVDLSSWVERVSPHCLMGLASRYIHLTVARRIRRLERRKLKEHRGEAVDIFNVCTNVASSPVTPSLVGRQHAAAAASSQQQLHDMSVSSSIVSNSTSKLKCEGGFLTPSPKLRRASARGSLDGLDSTLSPVQPGSLSSSTRGARIAAATAAASFTAVDGQDLSASFCQNVMPLVSPRAVYTRMPLMSMQEGPIVGLPSSSSSALMFMSDFSGLSNTARAVVGSLGSCDDDEDGDVPMSPPIAPVRSAGSLGTQLFSSPSTPSSGSVSSTSFGSPPSGRLATPHAGQERCSSVRKGTRLRLFRCSINRRSVNALVAAMNDAMVHAPLTDVDLSYTSTSAATLSLDENGIPVTKPCGSDLLGAGAQGPRGRNNGMQQLRGGVVSDSSDCSAFNASISSFQSRCSSSRSHKTKKRRRQSAESMATSQPSLDSSSRRPLEAVSSSSSNAPLRNDTHVRSALADISGTAPGNKPNLRGRDGSRKRIKTILGDAPVSHSSVLMFPNVADITAQSKGLGLDQSQIKAKHGICICAPDVRETLDGAVWNDASPTQKQRAVLWLPSSVLTLNLRGTMAFNAADVASVLRCCPSLRVLNVGMCPWVSDLLVDHIAQSPCAKTLSEIHLNNSPGVTDHSLRSLQKHCPSLTAVFVDMCDVTDDGVEVLAAGLPGLQRVGLCNNAITDRSVRALARHCPDLIQVELSFCYQLGGEALVQLARACAKLQDLNLCLVDNIGDDDVSGVAASCCDLRRLNLRACSRISDDSLDALRQNCPQLEMLHVLDCAFVTEGAVRLLKSEIPGCWVVS